MKEGCQQRQHLHRGIFSAGGGAEPRRATHPAEHQELPHVLLHGARRPGVLLL